jgi:heterodisulfide reductase subunit C
VNPVELIETLRNIAVREGFEAGHSIQDISDETGLPVLEVFQREKDLLLVPADEAFMRSAIRPV